MPSLNSSPDFKFRVRRMRVFAGIEGSGDGRGSVIPALTINSGSGGGLERQSSRDRSKFVPGSDAPGPKPRFENSADCRDE